MTDHTAEPVSSTPADLCAAPIDGEPEPCGLPAGHDEHMSPNVIGWQRALGGPVPGEPLAQGGIDTPDAEPDLERLRTALRRALRSGMRGADVLIEIVKPELRAAYERGKAETLTQLETALAEIQRFRARVHDVAAERDKALAGHAELRKFMHAARDRHNEEMAATGRKPNMFISGYGQAAAAAILQESAEAFERGKAEGIAEGRKLAADAIRNADTSGWPGGRGGDVDECQERAAALAEADDEVLTIHLTDEALANVHRWHAIAHPSLADRGVYEPQRNPGGCDRFFCLTHVVECSAVVAPRWHAAGIAEGLRQAASTIEDSAARLESTNDNTAAAIKATAVAWVAGLRISAKLAEGGPREPAEQPANLGGYWRINCGLGNVPEDQQYAAEGAARDVMRLHAGSCRGAHAVEWVPAEQPESAREEADRG